VTTPLPFIKLTHWQQIAFCAALLERMLPNYQMFSESAEFGEYKILRNQLDLIWQKLDKNNQTKININAQLNKLEAETPDPEMFDYFGVFPALDACMGLMSLWQLMQTKPQDDEQEDINSISRLSENSVQFYVELMISQSLENDCLEQDTDKGEVEKHPLMIWEKETQNELFDFLKFAAENKRTCQLVKKMVLSDGLSNLGIEIT